MADTTLSLGVDSSAVRRAATDLDRMGVAGKRAETASQGMAREFAGLKVALGGVAASLAVRQIVQTADAYKSLGARLQLVTRSSNEYATAQAALFRVAQDTRVGLEQTTDLFANLSRSTESLGVSQSELLGVTQTINQALVVSGTSAQSAAAALVQLGQGFAAGALRGDELNSVMEQAPRLARAIADGMGVSVGKLRELGQEGKITGETVFKALQKSADQINAEFRRMPLTVDQASTQAGNALMKLIGVMDSASGSTKGLAEGISTAAEWMGELATEIERASRGEENVGNLAAAFVRTTEAVKVLYAYLKFTFDYFGHQIGAAISRIEVLAEATENSKKRAGPFDLFGTGNFFDELSKAKPKFTGISEALKEDTERAIKEFHKAFADATNWRIKPAVDPAAFAAMDVLDPVRKRTDGGDDDKKKKNPFDTAVKSLREQIALVGKLTELEQVNAKIAVGSYGKLNAAQVQRLRSLAQELDAQKALEAVRKAATTSAVEGIRRDLSGMTAAYAGAESILEELRSQGLAGDKEYFEAKRAFIRLNADAQIRALEAENAALASQQATAEERIAIDRQIADNTAKMAEIRADAAAKTVINDAQQSAALDKVKRSYAEAEAAAQSYLDTLRRGFAIELGGMGLGNAERQRLAARLQIEDRYEQQRQVLASQRRSGDITEEQYRDELERIQRFQAEALRSFDSFYGQMQDKQADAAVGMSEALNNYLDDARNIARQTEDLFTSAFKGMEDALVQFVTTGKLDFKSLANSIIADLARIAVKQAILAPLAGAVKGSGFGSFLSMLFSAPGKAAGGPVSAGRLYEVNERGPELLNIGNRQFLMMGNQSGSVTPNGGAAPTVTITYNVAPGVTRGEVLQAMQMTREQTKADVLESMRRAGAFA